MSHRDTDNSRKRTHIALKAQAFEQDSYQSAITPTPGLRAILQAESQLSRHAEWQQLLILALQSAELARRPL